LGGLNNLFGNNKKEQEEQERIGKAMQSLSDQIASLQQTNLGKDKEIDRLREELSELQAKASGASGMSKADLQKLQSALAVAEADKQANQMMLQNAQKQVADLQTQLKTMQEQAAQVAQASPAAPQHMGATEAPALSAGVTAWVRRAGGMNLRRRSGPSLHSHVVDGIAPGTELTLIEGPVSADGHSWWNIRTADGREGWVAGEELVTSPE
jgi:predicted RNase H-like nuclease (RuvC/YqgF family)